MISDIYALQDTSIWKCGTSSTISAVILLLVFSSFKLIVPMSGISKTITPFRMVYTAAKYPLLCSLLKYPINWLSWKYAVRPNCTCSSVRVNSGNANALYSDAMRLVTSNTVEPANLLVALSASAKDFACVANAYWPPLCSWNSVSALSWATNKSTVGLVSW